MRRSSPTRSCWAATLALLGVAALALAACGGSDAAPTDLPTRTTPVAAYSVSSQETVPEDLYGMGTDGLEFVPWVDIEVTALGYYDEGGDGLVNEHTMGIFETSDRELVTAVVTVDGESALEDGFRYEPITPVVLRGGTTYVLAGSTSPPFDIQAAGGSDAAWAPEVRYVKYCFAPRGEFAFPWKSRQMHVMSALTGNFMFRSPSSSAPAATP